MYANWTLIPAYEAMARKALRRATHALSRAGGLPHRGGQNFARTALSILDKWPTTAALPTTTTTDCTTKHAALMAKRTALMAVRNVLRAQERRRAQLLAKRIKIARRCGDQQKGRLAPIETDKRWNSDRLNNRISGNNVRDLHYQLTAGARS